MATSPPGEEKRQVLFTWTLTIPGPCPEGLHEGRSAEGRGDGAVWQQCSVEREVAMVEIRGAVCGACTWLNEAGTAAAAGGLAGWRN